MEEILVENLTPGMILAQPAYYQGKPLVNAGFIITDKLIEKFRNFGVSSVFIKSAKKIEEKKPIAAGGIEIKTFGPGEYICFQGDQSKHIYILREGELEVVVTEAQKITPTIVEQTGRVISTLKGTNINFGEIGAILGTSRSASIRALTKSVVAMIPTAGSALIDSIMKNPKLGLSIAITLTTRMKETNAKISILDKILKSIQEKVEYNYKAFLAICTQMGKKSTEMRYEKWIREIHEMSKISPIYIQALKFAKRTIIPQTEPPEDNSDDGFVLSFREMKEFEMGDTICTEGEEGHELFILASGRLGVYIGNQRVASITKHGSVIGEMAVLLGYKSGKYEKRTATIKAVSDCQLIVIQGDSLEYRIQKDPDIIAHIVKNLAERLPITNGAYFSTRNEILKQLEKLNCAAEFKKIMEFFEKNIEKKHLCDTEFKLCELMCKKAANDYSASLASFYEEDSR